MKSLSLPENIDQPLSRDEILEIIYNDRIKFMKLLSAGMVQEIQTPLNIIRDLVSTVVKNQSQETTGKLNVILQETESLLRLVESIDVFPKTTKATMTTNTLTKSVLLVRPLIDQVASYFHKDRLEKGIAFYVDVEPLVQIISEPTILQNILMTLIHNAVQSFNSDKPTKVRCIAIHTSKKGDSLNLSISDTGIGMSLELQNRILIDNNRYSQLPRNSGLNLALAQKMAHDLDIEMHFVSEPRMGTTFTLTFKT